MAAQCVGRVVAYRVTFVLAFHEGGFQWPKPSSVWNALRIGGRDLSISRSAGTFWLNQRTHPWLFRPVAALGEYTGADRFTRFFKLGMWIANQVLYPKLTHQIRRS
jgi:hypothetical protein